jgi:hypothetical protein
MRIVQKHLSEKRGMDMGIFSLAEFSGTVD